MPHSTHTICHTVHIQYATQYTYNMPHSTHTICHTVHIQYVHIYTAANTYIMPHTVLEKLGLLYIFEKLVPLYILAQ